MSKREPSTNVEVYSLGHYETMQIDMALKAFLENDEEVYDELLDTIDDTTLRRLNHIFSHGTITILRTLDEE